MKTISMLVIAIAVPFASTLAFADDQQLLAQCECYIKKALAAPLSYNKLKSSVAPAPNEYGGKSRIDVMFEALTNDGATSKGYAICIAFNSGAGVSSVMIDGRKVPRSLEYLQATFECDHIGN